MKVRELDPLLCSSKDVAFPMRHQASILHPSYWMFKVSSKKKTRWVLKESLPECCVPTIENIEPSIRLAPEEHVRKHAYSTMDRRLPSNTRLIFRPSRLDFWKDQSLRSMELWNIENSHRKHLHFWAIRHLWLQFLYINIDVKFEWEVSILMISLTIGDDYVRRVVTTKEQVSGGRRIIDKGVEWLDESSRHEEFIALLCKSGVTPQSSFILFEKLLCNIL